MTREEFQKIVSDDPVISRPIVRAAVRAGLRAQFSAGPLPEPTSIVMFVVTLFLLKNIGLPWLHEVSRYSELWRQKFHAWIDGEYRKHGLDPGQAEAAGKALRSELEAVTGADARGAWERFRDLLSKDDLDE